MDRQPSQGVGLELCAYYAWRRAQYGHSALASPATRMSFVSLFTVSSTTVVHHSLLGASVVLSICTCALNYGFVVEPIFVINMVGYEISDCLLSNSKHVIFKLGINCINYGLIRDYTALGLRKRNVCDIRGDQKCF